ncbi:MAG: hypothetical protein ACKO1F_09985 [Flammeovirgaceae bacterium]
MVRTIATLLANEGALANAEGTNAPTAMAVVTEQNNKQSMMPPSAIPKSQPPN